MALIPMTLQSKSVLYGVINDGILVNLDGQTFSRFKMSNVEPYSGQEHVEINDIRLNQLRKASLWSLVDSLEPLAKYSPDQTRDYHGRFAFSDNSATTAEDSHLPTTDAEHVLWDNAKDWAGVSSNVVQHSERMGKVMKDRVTKEISASMQDKGVSLAELWTTSSFHDSKELFAVDKTLDAEPNPEIGPLSDYSVVYKTEDGSLSAWSGEWVVNAVSGPTVLADYRNGEKVMTAESFTSYVEDLNKQMAEDSNLGIVAQVAEPNTPEAEQLAYQAGVSNLISYWARSANDDFPPSLAMQEVAKQEFNLQNTSSWKMGSDTSTAVEALVEQNQNLYKVFLQSQYDATQKLLTDRDITSIEIYRGIYNPEKDFPKGNNVEIQTRPLTSWTTDYETARQFSMHDWGIQNGNQLESSAVLHAVVPASQVFSLPLSGVGCYHEKEVVLLGGTFNVDSSLTDALGNPL